jgi:hypothetical protein
MFRHEAARVITLLGGAAAAPWLVWPLGRVNRRAASACSWRSTKRSGSGTYRRSISLGLWSESEVLRTYRETIG